MDPSPSSARQTLPPIHTVLGDQLRLEIPTAISHSPHSSSSYASFYTCDEGGETSPEPPGSGRSRWLTRSPTRPRAFTIPLPPLLTLPPGAVNSSAFTPKTYSLPVTPVPSTSGSPTHLLESPHDSYGPSGSTARLEPKGKNPQITPTYSYSILRPSPSGELITAPQIKRGRRQKRNNTSSNTQAGTSNSASQQRHVCSICQKRFNRPSSLQTHLSVHTGSRPFECLHPTCTKVFSVASNMRRHFRKHHAHHTGTTPLAVGDVRRQQHQQNTQHQQQYTSTSSWNDESRASSDGDGDEYYDDAQMELEMDAEEDQSSSLSPIVLLRRFSAEHHGDKDSST